MVDYAYGNKAAEYNMVRVFCVVNIWFKMLDKVIIINKDFCIINIIRVFYSGCYRM